MSQSDRPNFQPQKKWVLPRAVVEDIVDTLYGFLTNSLRSSDRYKDITKLTKLEREGMSRLGILMSKYEVVSKNMDDWLKDGIKLVLEEEREERISAFKTFSTRCPYCGQEGSIVVIKVTLTLTGTILRPKVPLRSDGFNIHYHGAFNEKDLSTENEQVRCNNCGTEYNLSELVF